MSPRSFLTLPFFVGLALGAFAMRAGADMLGSAVFPDVQPGSYYDAALGRLYGQGIFKGGGDGKFHPEQPVNRAELAVLLDRAFNGGAVPMSSSSRSSRSRVSSSASSESSQSVSSSVSSSSLARVGEAGAFRFAVDKVAISESSTNVSLSIIRYSGNAGSVSVTYKTSDGTAKAAEDYNEATGTVAFADGETSKLVKLTFINDGLGEASESFAVTLSDPTGGAVLGAPTTTTVTILDNDGGAGAGGTASSGASSSVNSSAGGGVFTFSAVSYAAPENAGAVSITVLRQGSTSVAATVDYDITDGSAQAGTHYTKTQGTLSFSAGEASKTFSVQVNDNTTIEGNKTATLKLLKPTAAAVLGTATSVPLTIVDNEATSTASGSVLFSAESYSAVEKDERATITVLRRNGYERTITVKYTTGDSTATGGSDYTISSGTMTFAPNESSKTFVVPILQDTLQESEEKLNLTLSDVSGGMLGSQAASVLFIR